MTLGAELDRKNATWVFKGSSVTLYLTMALAMAFCDRLLVTIGSEDPTQGGKN